MNAVSEFKAFLFQHCLYRLFEGNIKDYSSYIDVDTYLNAMSEFPSQFVLSAFDWSCTAEGPRFWDLVDELWHKTL